MNIDDKFHESFERLLPELYDVPLDNNGVPVGHLPLPGGLSTYAESDVHPYAAMYRIAAEQALEQST